MKTLIDDCQLLIIYINHQSLIINTIHIIVINAVPKCHRLMTDHKMSSLIRPQKCSRSLTDCIFGSAIVACGNIGSTTLKAPSIRVADPVSQRDGGRFQKWKSYNDSHFWCRIKKRNCAMIFLVMSNALNKKSCNDLFI